MGGPGALLILHLLAFPSSGNLQSTLHVITLTQTKRLRKEIKYILINNKALPHQELH